MYAVVVYNESMYNITLSKHLDVCLMHKLFCFSFQASTVTHLWSSYETAASTARHSTSSASLSHVVGTSTLTPSTVSSQSSSLRRCHCHRRRCYHISGRAIANGLNLLSTIASTGRVFTSRGREWMRWSLLWMNLAASDDRTAVGACLLLGSRLLEGSRSLEGLGRLTVPRHRFQEVERGCLARHRRQK